MSEDFDDEPQTICSALPLAVADDGQLCISCNAVTKLLRVIALACQRSADDTDTRVIADILTQEADMLDCRALEHRMGAS